MSLATAYAVKRREKKGACPPDCPGCHMCHGGKMAHGGDVKGVHKPIKAIVDDEHGMGEEARGVSHSGILTRSGQGYSEKKEKEGGYYADAKAGHKKVLGEMHSMRGQDRKYLAHGGLVDRIMMSHGGEVANDTHEGEFVDEMPNEFDDLVLEDSLNEHYTGANSGDELGNAHEDEEDRELIAQIMRSRHKKDRMPRPA